MKLTFLVSVVLLCSTGALLAQSDRATVTGTVRDTSGAVVVGAQVVISNLNNNLRSSVTSDAAGRFTLLNLPIGQYTFACLKDGFAQYTRSGISLSIGEASEIDVVLTIGSRSEAVTVVRNTSQLQTQTPSISTILENAAISSLPLNVQGGRNLSAFMFAYVPGVEGSGTSSSDKDFSSHINGSLSKTKEVMIDGTSAVSQIGGYLSESSPPMEAVEEFQVTSAATRADEGRSGGGVFRYQMKSGSNAWHGSGFYYMHNEALDARSWGNVYNEGICLNTANGDPAQTGSCQRAFGKPDDRLYTYGASIGGPLKKDKLFFYSAWERYAFANHGLGKLTSTVPTAAFLGGDFTSLLGAQLCKQPDGGVVPNCAQGTPIFVHNNAGQSVALQQGMIFDPQTGNQFANNTIPTTRFSAVSRRIVDLYKRYYQPLSSDLVSNIALPLNSPATWYHSNQVSIKLDFDATSRHRLDGSFIYAYIPRLLSDQGGIWSPGSADGGPMANAYDHDTTAPSIRLRDSWTLSSTLLNVFTVTFNRFHNPSTAHSRSGNWPAAVGLGDFGAGNFPVIKFQGVNGDQHRYAAGDPVDESSLGSQFNDHYAANTFLYADSLSWVRGRYTHRFGAEFRAQQFNSHGDSGVPTFIFNPAQTAGSFANVNTCENQSGCMGFGLASFLLGNVNQASVSEPNNTYGRRKSISLYAQNDIKLTAKLTLNADLRWDFNGRYHEKYGHWSNFNTTAVNPVTGLSGALEFAGGGGDSFEKRQYYHNFSGFVGGAYQLASRTVARASFGIFYVPLNLNTWSGIPYAFNPGFVLNNQVLTPFNWDTGYPGQAVAPGKDPNFTRWGIVSVDPRALELGNVQSWSVGVQRELTSDLTVEANFIQQHGHHLESGYVAANQPKLADYSALVQSNQLWSWVTKPGFSGFGWASVAPFPNVAMTFGPLFFVGSPLGNSDYRSFQVTGKKRWGHGLSLLASYNLSSSHGDVDDAFEDLYWAGPLQDVYNLGQERRTISSFDQTHIVKGYVLYDLPFGRGKTLIADATPALNALVGGWTLSGGFHYNTGSPLRIPASVYYPGINNVYADIVPGCDIGRHYNGQVGGTYFNPACFANPQNGEFGTAPGYLAQLRGPGFASEDLGVSKALSFGRERYQLRLYFQMFNVLNRHGFKGPETQIGTPDFGKVLPQDLDGLPGPRVGQFGARLNF